MKRNLRQWATIHRGLGNQSRLRILKLLSDHGTMSVSVLAEELGISFKNTSRNLRILQGLDIIEFEGRHDKVYYNISSTLDPEIKKILNIVL